jgi:A118 family predicted phage portal protein
MGLNKTTLKAIAKATGVPVPVSHGVSQDYYNLYRFSPTAAIAKSVSSLTLEDSDIKVTGESRRADSIRSILDLTVTDILPDACELALGSGDCIIRPYYERNHFGVTIIDNRDFYICDSCGDFIFSCIMVVDKIERENGDVFKHVEVQQLVDTTLKITSILLRNGNIVPLGSVPEWSSLEPEYVITDCDSLLIGRIKCPTLDRGAINKKHGVSITNGLDGLINDTLKAYNRYEDEFEKKEAFVFADKSLFKRDTSGDGSMKLPRGRERLFQQMPSTFTDDAGVSSKIYEYSPDIRETEFRAGLELQFKLLELMCGLSQGILTSPTTTYATATEIKASLHLTFAYITRFRRNIAKGVKQLVNAIDVLCDVHKIDPAGEYSVTMDWSSAYVENLTEQFDRLTRSLELGVVDRAEVRSWVLDETVDIAERKLDAIDGNPAAFSPPSSSKSSPTSSSDPS